MLMYDAKESSLIRKKYIHSFVNTKSVYYKKHVRKKKRYCDGLCYDGYLWDCLSCSQSISEEEARNTLFRKNEILIMWDIHSCEKIWIPHYWRYPKTAVLQLDIWNSDLEITFPEDIYCFDSSYSWSIILTHETDQDNKRWCMLARGK